MIKTFSCLWILLIGFSVCGAEERYLIDVRDPQSFHAFAIARGGVLIEGTHEDRERMKNHCIGRLSSISAEAAGPYKFPGIDKPVIFCAGHQWSVLLHAATLCRIGNLRLLGIGSNGYTIICGHKPKA